MAPALAPGDLVIVGKLSSPKYGIVRSAAAADGRLNVELIGRRTKGHLNHKKSAPPVPLRASTLRAMGSAMKERTGDPILAQYLGNMVLDMVDAGCEAHDLYPVWAERSAIASVLANMKEKASLVGILRCTGRAAEAVTLAQGVVAEVALGEPRRGRILYDLGLSFIDTGRLDEAVDAVRPLVAVNLPASWRELGSPMEPSRLTF